MGNPFQAQSYEFTEYMSAQNWIGGQWQDAQNTEMLDVINPRYGKTMAQVCLSGATDVEKAVGHEKLCPQQKCLFVNVARSAITSVS